MTTATAHCVCIISRPQMISLQWCVAHASSCSMLPAASLCMIMCRECSLCLCTLFRSTGRSCQPAVLGNRDKQLASVFGRQDCSAAACDRQPAAALGGQFDGLFSRPPVRGCLSAPKACRSKSHPQTTCATAVTCFVNKTELHMSNHVDTMHAWSLLHPATECG